MKTQIQAELALVLVTVCWGVSYFTTDICLREMEPFDLNAFRFLGAFIVTAAVTFPKLRSVNAETIKYAALIGVILTVVYASYTFGLQRTSQSNAGFLCAMSVIFTPIILFLVKRIVPEKKLLLVLVMCFTGIALMTLDSDLKIGTGDLLCLLCSLAYTMDLLITEHAVAKENVDALQLGVFQLFFTGAFMLALSFIFEDPVLPSSGAGWASGIFLAIFCTGISFIVQSIAQQYTTASHVGVIFCLEPVFAAIVAFFLAGEVLLPRAYAGAFLMLAGLFLMEIRMPVKTGSKSRIGENCNETEDTRDTI